MVERPQRRRPRAVLAGLLTELNRSLAGLAICWGFPPPEVWKTEADPVAASNPAGDDGVVLSAAERCAWLDLSRQLAGPVDTPGNRRKDPR
ncbi:hypothetical protein OOJ91_07635 [Micromonospora lupini]|uniref:hypothetical protein n=1 Tax=Micromonospora lupini TaxID=285679 RepID=UPI002253DA5B|nr:hypothetical protein [Micromonospora lupini]MCX5065751.1 hypothetical protein [Micromonospora lupini]